MPDCRAELIKEGISSDGPAHSGKIAHIIPHSIHAKHVRQDLSYPIEKRDKYENLILLCPSCHDTVDVPNSIYSATMLREFKLKQEKHARDARRAAMAVLGLAELVVVMRAIALGTGEPPGDFTVIPMREKMARNGLSDEVGGQLVEGVAKSKEVQKALELSAQMDTAFPDRLKGYFVAEYRRLRSEGIAGDLLFDLILDFACYGDTQYKRQAAALAVVSYLFEACEIFEK